MKLPNKLRGTVRRVINKRNFTWLVVASLLLAVCFLYRELSSIRRDLYGIRGDYYSQQGEEVYVEEAPPTVELLNQTVKTVRITDYDKYNEEGDVGYKKIPVREVIVRVKNNYSYVTTIHSIAYADSKGRIIRPIDTLHPDDNQNKSAELAGLVELAPGGEVTYFLYFVDDGRSIDKLLYLDTY